MDVDSATAMCTEAKTGKPDIAWVAHTQRNAQTENSRLNVELNGFMSNLIKESIRVSYFHCVRADISSRTSPWPSCPSRRAACRRA